MSIKIAIGSDHAGYGLKCEVIKHLKEQNIDFIEMGCMDGTSCDYPVVAKEVCDKVVDGTVDRAVLICGTGIGISMAANKVKGNRSLPCCHIPYPDKECSSPLNISLLFLSDHIRHDHLRLLSFSFSSYFLFKVLLLYGPLLSTAGS